MKKAFIQSYLFLLLFLLACPARAEDTVSVDQLKAQLEALKADYEKRIADLEKQLQEIQVQMLQLPTEPATPAQAAAPASPTTFSALNPAIALRSVRLSAREQPRPDPFRIQEAEALIAGGVGATGAFLIGVLTGRLDKEKLRDNLRRTARRRTSDLKDFRVPTLLIAGGRDVVFPPFLASAIAATLPCADAQEMPESGHSPYFEDAARFNQLVERFLALHA